jgi:hypothetical protein
VVVLPTQPVDHLRVSARYPVGSVDHHERDDGDVGVLDVITRTVGPEWQPTGAEMVGPARRGDLHIEWMLR